MNYQLGNYVRISAVFKDLTGALTDPTGVTVFYTKPDGTESHADANRASIGSYYTDLLADVAGVWHYRVVSYGNVVAAYEGSFGVHSLQSNYS
jgi:hypothetical protein